MRNLFRSFALWLSVAAVLVVPLASSDIKMPSFHRHILPNGLTVIMVEKHVLPIVEGQLIIRSGALSDPPEKEGLANIVIRMIARGAAGKTAADISRAIDDSGAEMQFSADWKTSGVAFRVLKGELPKVLELSADLVRLPEFSPEEFRLEKSKVQAEIQGWNNDNLLIADRWFRRALYRGSRLAKAVIGEAVSVENLTIDDARTFRKAHYVPANAALLLGGDIDRGDLGLVEKAFSGWARTDPPVSGRPKLGSPVTGRTIWIVDKPDMAQCQIHLGSDGIPWNHPDYPSAQILNAIFGGGMSSILMEELRRKRGLTYGVSSKFEFDQPNGPFSIWTFTENEKVGELLTLTVDLMRKVHDGAISEKEVGAAKQYLLGGYARGLQSPESVGSLLLRLHWAGMPLEDIRAHSKSIQGVTLEQVRMAAKKYIDPDNCCIVILGKRSEIEGQVKEFRANLRFAHYREGSDRP
jgi:zinc protease